MLEQLSMPVSVTREPIRKGSVDSASFQTGTSQAASKAAETRPLIASPEERKD